MIDTISVLRAYALKHARALRILRSVKAQGQADAYQDMGNRLTDLEKEHADREPLVQEVIACFRLRDTAPSPEHRWQAGNALEIALSTLAEWTP